MDKVTDAKLEFRLKQWTKIIQACQASDMTAVAWCSQNNIRIKSYYYWLCKLRSMACESGELPVRSNEKQIIPLAFKQTKAPVVASITIHLPAVSIDIHDGASRATIEAVLSGLEIYARRHIKDRGCLCCLRIHRHA